MKRYIEQLIEDIHQATWNLKPPHRIWEESEADPDNELEREDMSYVEEYFYGEEIPISEITGIEQEKLPPPEQLSKKHQALLATELEKLLLNFHFHLDFPTGYPAHLRYSFIYELWQEKHVPLSFGESHIEFCDYNEEDCPFPGYCNSCREMSEQMKFDEQHGLDADFDFDLDPNLLLPGKKEIEDFFRDKDQDSGENDDNGEDDPLSPEDGLPF